MHAVPDDAVVTTPRWGEAYSEGQAPSERLDEQRKYLAALLSVGDEADSTFSVVLFVRFGVDSRRKVVFNHPSVNVGWESFAREAFLAP